MRLALILIFPALLAAQLITNTQQIPKGANPPVVFINGYQQDCTSSDFNSNFSGADKLLQNNSIATLYFDNCSVGGTGSNRASIEAEGAGFGKFLNALRYTDGSAVAQVDIVGYSLGGLIVRSYLSGKQDAATSTFNPPANTLVRKGIFIASPNFGTPIASLLGSSGDIQLQEMTPGSQFLFDLNTWNQGIDDLRGIDAISVAGNGGAETPGIANFDDGVVPLTSASLGFYKTNVTRVVPDCHTTNALLQFAGYCSAGTPPISQIDTNPNNPVAQIVVSFLTGSNAWKSTGQPIETTAASTRAGLELEARDMNDVKVPLIGANIASPYGSYALSANGGSNIVYNDFLNVGVNTLQVSPLTGAVQTAAIDLTGYATTERPYLLKPGPAIFAHGVIPAAGPAPFPYDVAPGAYVSIYGTNLASATQQSPPPYPNQIADVQVLVNGVPQQVVFISSGQINFVYPNSAPGLTQLTVKNSNGQNTVNVRVAPSVPSIFGAPGEAAAIDVFPATVVTPGVPLHEKDYVSLYLTGLGSDTTNVAVSIGGQSIPVLYAGTTAGLPGLNQINCQIPVGIAKGSAVPVVITSSGRSSSPATLAIQ